MREGYGFIGFIPFFVLFGWFGGEGWLGEKALGGLAHTDDTKGLEGGAGRER